MKKKIITLVTVISVCALTMFVPFIADSGVLESLSMLVAVLGVVLLVVELYQTRRVSEAEFIANLNQSFVTNDDYKNAYMLFENYDFANLPNIELDNIYISNYLTFFEVFHLLIDRGTLKIDMVDDLFGYRFFIAVHNPYVQKMKLVTHYQNFKNLYKLEHDWVEYRRKKGLPIFHEEYCLENQLSKEEYVIAVFGKEKNEICSIGK